VFVDRKEFSLPLRGRCAETWSRGPDFRGCDREGARKHAGKRSAASCSKVASKHNALGTYSALRGRRVGVGHLHLFGCDSVTGSKFLLAAWRFTEFGEW
jgi:hypothetical protein